MGKDRNPLPVIRPVIKPVLFALDDLRTDDGTAFGAPGSGGGTTNQILVDGYPILVDGYPIIVSD